MAGLHVFRSSTVVLLLAASLVAAQRALYSDSFAPCVDNSSLTATFFNVSVTPDNNTVAYDLSGRNNFAGNVTLGFTVTVDSQTAYHTTLDPCTSADWPNFCPSTPAEIALSSNQHPPPGAFDRIPDAAYSSASPDAYFRLSLNNTATGELVGCLQANLTNDVAAQAGADMPAATNSSTATGADGANVTDSAGRPDTSGGAGAGSAASTAYVSWTLLVSAIIVLVCCSSSGSNL